MTTQEIISAIDGEISKLQQVRSLLSIYSDPTSSVTKKVLGRPKKIASTGITPRRVLSAEARARIVAAQKKRWAAHKKATK